MRGTPKTTQDTARWYRFYVPRHIAGERSAYVGRVLTTTAEIRAMFPDCIISGHDVTVTRRP
jgi:hypothetical protein